MPCSISLWLTRCVVPYIVYLSLLMRDASSRKLLTLDPQVAEVIPPSPPSLSLAPFLHNKLPA